MNDNQNPSRLARDLLARDRRHVWHPFTQHGTERDPIVLIGAKGALLFDVEGNEILDLVSSWWTCTHGHSHPKLNAALAKQAERFEHVMFAGFTHQPAVANGASELMKEVFGEDGKHARVAVGVSELPLGAPVEVDAVATLEA